MTNSMTFPAQIASVMEVLANAAVAQICKLVDDDYAVFRLEMTQSQRENRVLRRKVQTLELKMARERAERTMRERVLAHRVGSNVTAGVKILDKFRGAAARGEGFLPGRHRSFGTPGEDAEGEEEGAWRPDDPSVASSEGPDSSTQGVITVTILGECSGGKPGGSVSSQLKQERSPPPPPPPPPPARPGPDRQSEEPEDTGAEVCLVKEERKEGEEEEEEGGVSCDLDSALITGGELSGAASAGDWTMEPSPRTWPPRVPQEPLLLHHDPDPSPGSEPDHQGAGFSLSDHAHWTGGASLGGLGPVSMVPHIWTQRRPVADSGAGVGSGSGIGSAPGARPDLGSGSGSGVGPGPGARPDLGSVPRPSMNHLPPPPHSYLPTLHGLRTHPQHQRSPAAYSTLLYPHNTLAAGSKTHHSSAAAPAAVGPSGGGGGAPRPLQPGRADLRGKADSERPYSCPTCGKRFTEASYVKKHQTVHTREKPFRCKQCWKSFSFLSNLIRHRGVHRVSKDQGGAVEWTL